MDYFRLGINDLKSALAKSPAIFSDVLSSLHARVKAVDEKVNAYLSFDISRSPKSMNELPKGALQGIPVSLKDNICTQGWEVTCASNVLQGYIPPYDATVVKKLKDAGAFIFAKCDMDEFAFGSSSETSCYNGRNATKKKIHQGVKNPWDFSRIPGGSSGGSAACVAADEAICSLGSDTGGSIRQPAALCGVVGMKPTYGRVSRYGLVAFGSSLDQIGPFTKTVADNALLLQTIAGHDPLDSTSADVPVENYSNEIGKDVKGLRIGIPKEYFIEGIDPEVLASIRQAIAFYKDRGAVIQEISLPHTKYAVAVYYIIGTAEASSNLARFDGIRYGKRAEEARTLDEVYFKSRSQGFGAEAKRRILLGTFVLSSGYYDAYYKKAQQVRTLIKRDFEEAFKVCDVILTPTAPTPAFKIGEKMNDPLAMYLSDIFTISTNLAGVPAMSIPCGLTKSNLPIGMQLIGGFFQEGMIYRAAHYFEQHTEHHKQRPSL